MSVSDVVGRLRFLDRMPGQIGMLVEDLGGAMVTWSAVLGSDDWQAYTYDADVMCEAQYRGAPSNFGMHVAVSAASEAGHEPIQSARGYGVGGDGLAQPDMEPIGSRSVDTSRSTSQP